MHASRSERRRVTALLAPALLALSVLAPVAVSGQQPSQPVGPPIPLLPTPFLPTPSPLPAEPPEAWPTVSHRDAALTTEPLAPPIPGWAAAKAPPRDPLPEGFWHGTSRAMAELLLTHLPGTTSLALQSLERRLLLSPAAAPEGPDVADHTLPALRAAALLRLGELDAARAVIAAVPDVERVAALPIAVAADAIAGDVKQACATVRDTVRRESGAPWQTALIACQALQGETEQASLGLQLLDEEQTSRDEALSAAVEALAGTPPTTPVNLGKTVEPLTVRLLVKARLPLTANWVEALRPDLALCLALDEETPVGTRLAAAERAARFGALAPDRLRALYAVGAGDLGDQPALDHARRFAAIERAETATDRLGRIIGLVSAFSGSQPGDFTLAAGLVLPALRQIEPAPSLAGSAPIITRLLLAAGDTRAARRWSALVPETEAHSLRFLLALAGGGGELEPPRVPVLAALSSALGDRKSPTDWLGLPETSWASMGQSAPPPAAWLDLAEAARAKRIGETVLAAVLVAAPTGTLATDPIALFTAVSSLKQIGLEPDARRLAVEAALAAEL